MTASDPRRSLVYAAERVLHDLLDSADATGVRSMQAFGSALTLPTERRFASLDSVQRYVDAVLALNWVQRQWPAAAGVPVRVRERRGRRSAHYEPGVIALPLHERGTAWALRELVVLHEIGHHLSPGGHDVAFVTTLLTLVGEIVGPEAAFVLRAAMHENGALASD